MKDITINVLCGFAQGLITLGTDIFVTKPIYRAVITKTQNNNELLETTAAVVLSVFQMGVFFLAASHLPTKPIEDKTWLYFISFIVFGCRKGMNSLLLVGAPLSWTLWNSKDIRPLCVDIKNVLCR